MDVDEIARICHEANRAYCETIGDTSQVSWEDAPEWQRNSAIKGVVFNREHPDYPTSATHDSWLAEKIADGWVYGEVKNADAKTHPCVMPYDALPNEQRLKDSLFKAIVFALSVTEVV